MLAGLSATALADPLADLLKKGDGGACFDRVYDKAHLDKHPGQQTTAIRLSLQRDEDGSDAIIRVALSDKKRTNYIVGGCNWAAKANLDINDQPLIEAFKGPSGLELLRADQRGRLVGRRGRRFPDRPEGRQVDPALSAGRYRGVAVLRPFQQRRVHRARQGRPRVQAGHVGRRRSCREMDSKLPWLL